MPSGARRSCAHVGRRYHDARHPHSGTAPRLRACAAIALRERVGGLIGAASVHPDQPIGARAVARAGAVVAEAEPRLAVVEQRLHVADLEELAGVDATVVASPVGNEQIGLADRAVLVQDVAFDAVAATDLGHPPRLAANEGPLGGWILWNPNRTAPCASRKVADRWRDSPTSRHRHARRAARRRRGRPPPGRCRCFRRRAPPRRHRPRCPRAACRRARARSTTRRR